MIDLGARHLDHRAIYLEIRVERERERCEDRGGDAVIEARVPEWGGVICVQIIFANL